MRPAQLVRQAFAVTRLVRLVRRRPCDKHKSCGPRRPHETHFAQVFAASRQATAETAAATTATAWKGKRPGESAQQRQPAWRIAARLGGEVRRLPLARGTLEDGLRRRHLHTDVRAGADGHSVPRLGAPVGRRHVRRGRRRLGGRVLGLQSSKQGRCSDWQASHCPLRRRTSSEEPKSVQHSATSRDLGSPYEHVLMLCRGLRSGSRGPPRLSSSGRPLGAAQTSTSPKGGIFGAWRAIKGGGLRDLKERSARHDRSRKPSASGGVRACAAPSGRPELEPSVAPGPLKPDSQAESQAQTAHRLRGPWNSSKSESWAFVIGQCSE